MNFRSPPIASWSNLFFREAMANTAGTSNSLFAFEPGVVLGRRYRIDATIASGGMGTVFRATHLALGHEVAVKVLHDRALNDDALRRFAREARLAAHLGESSRHIARVVDYGVEEGRPFLVMELLRGEDLRERLERNRQLPIELVVRFVAQLCEALDVAHEQGVVHRDIKPANIFLARSGSVRAPVVTVKLMDFGVATLRASSPCATAWCSARPRAWRPSRSRDARSICAPTSGPLVLSFIAC